MVAYLRLPEREVSKMADKQFDLSPEQKKLFLQRAQRRQELRTEFLKIKHNPFQGLAGGVVSTSCFYKIT